MIDYGNAPTLRWDEVCNETNMQQEAEDDYDAAGRGEDGYEDVSEALAWLPIFVMTAKEMTAAPPEGETQSEKLKESSDGLPFLYTR